MWLFSLLLRVYPGSFQKAFATEMLLVLQQAASERPGSLCFFGRESLGLLRGAVLQWIPRTGAPLMGSFAAAVVQLFLYRHFLGAGR
jgi:hypothetical protein